MGSFAGHAVPGTFFVVISLWWAFSLWSRYFRARQRAPQQEGAAGKRKWEQAFRSQPTFPFRCCPTFPTEGVFKVVAALLGATGELVTAFKFGRFTHMMNLQHIAMFCFFGLNGVVDILVSAGVPLPPDTDYVTMVMALFVEFLLFFFHLHGRSPMDVHVHVLLTWVIAFSALVVLLEMKYRHHPLCPLLRVVTTLLQGTWFWQVGFILYNPFPGAQPWDENNHNQIMIITTLFTGHLALDFLVVGVCGILVCFWIRRTSRAWDKDIPFQTLNNNNHQTEKRKGGSHEVNDDSSDF